ncbi:hypothetical protein KJ865_12660, partial [Myxococcota bacterium]|nr:hypothetical protein [Myxococcota bacterium]
TAPAAADSDRRPRSALSCNRNSQCLDAFFSSLEPVEVSHRTVRIAYYSDSMINGGTLTGSLRRLFQKRFGGRGLGWIPPASHPAVLQKPGVEIVSRGWKVQTIVGPWNRYARYGVGGILATIYGDRGSTTVKLKRPIKNIVLTVGFIRRRYGGRFHINIPGMNEVSLSTRGRGWTPDFFHLHVKGPLRQFTITSTSGGFVTLTGFSLEGAQKKGTRIDGMGLIGTRFIHHTRRDPGHWHRALALWRPSLLVFHLGSNDHPHDLTAARHRAIVTMLRNFPCLGRTCSCLLIGVMERVSHVDSAIYRTTPLTHRLRSFYRSIAASAGCGFFDSFSAMGGERSSISWYRSSPRLLYGDLVHLTPLGGGRFARLLMGALMSRYDAYRKRIARSRFGAWAVRLKGRGFLGMSPLTFHPVQGSIIHWNTR